MERHGKDRPGSLTPEDAFAKALREIRLEQGISQESLGLDSGYHRTYMSMLERGKVNPSLRTILSMAAVLGVPAVEIIRRVEANLGRPWQKPEKNEKTPRRKGRGLGPKAP